jgi:hypothetical protein
MPDSIMVLSRCGSAVWYKLEKTGICDSKFYDNHQVLSNIVMLVTEVLLTF